MNSSQRKPPPAIVWWIIWGAILVGLTMIYFTVRPAPARVLSEGLRFVPLVPLAVATMVRWLLLPRLSGAPAFPIFVLGIALAEACGIFGIFLVPSLKQEYFLLSIAGIAQFVPSLISRENGPTGQ